MGPFQNLITTYPDLRAWVAASPEEMGIVLLRDLRPMQPQFSLHNILATMRERHYHEWGGAGPTEQRLGPIAEAYQWLRSIGIITPAPGNPADFDVVARAARHADDNGIRDYIAARLSCYELLDHRISDKVWAVYLRGDHDIAIAYAFKVVEIRMREMAGLTTSDYGERLVKKFFEHFEPSTTGAKGMPDVVHLLIGAFNRYRNEATHQDVATDREETLELLLLANHCLRITERAGSRLLQQ